MKPKLNSHYLLLGKAGTGKTHEALSMALSLGKKIVVIRSAVAVRDIGFLPGESDDKMAPYFDIYKPLFSKLTKKRLSQMVQSGFVRFLPTSFLRGYTFEDSVVILDEAENCSLQELETVLTRVGKDSILIVVGDEAQSDLSTRECGFQEFTDAYQEIPNVEVVELFENRRSKLLTQYFKAKR